jgi:hypothetical protein
MPTRRSPTALEARTPPTTATRSRRFLARARLARAAAIAALGLGAAASPTAAQHVFESVGERALGMGGAFVAVADDATAVHWESGGSGDRPGGRNDNRVGLVSVR